MRAKKVETRLIRYGDLWFAQVKIGSFGLWHCVDDSGVRYFAPEEPDEIVQRRMSSYIHKDLYSAAESLVLYWQKSGGGRGGWRRGLAESMKRPPDEVIAVSGELEAKRLSLRLVARQRESE